MVTHARGVAIAPAVNDDGGPSPGGVNGAYGTQTAGITDLRDSGARVLGTALLQLVRRANSAERLWSGCAPVGRSNERVGARIWPLIQTPRGPDPFVTSTEVALVPAAGESTKSRYAARAQGHRDAT